jgi:serine/threonine protein phosphatase PrpC
MDLGFHINGTSGTNQGGRLAQEDRVLLIEHPRYQGCVLGIVADGMGGTTGGRNASDQVIFTANQLFERFAPHLDDAAGFLRQIAMEAHRIIRLVALTSELKPHSTIAAFLMTPQASCHWIHAGDSRIYQFRGGRIALKTADHSRVQAMVARGELNREEVATHPESNVLTSCLGTEIDPMLEEQTIDKLAVGDSLLVCSDGLWHYLRDDELCSIAQSLPPNEACRLLIEIACRRSHGRGDNVSVILVNLGPQAAPRKRETRTTPQKTIYGGLAA